MRIAIFAAVGLAVIGLLVLAGCSRQQKSDVQSQQPPAQASAQAVAQVKDPVCGMAVSTSSDYKADYQGKTYYFCSTTCRDTFLKDSAKYAVN
jgi:YHS domain-containing protein